MLEKSASLHHLARANLSRLAWAKTGREHQRKGKLDAFLKINVEW